MERLRPGRRIRIGHAERQEAVALLAEHYAAGRLDITEYDERCAATAAARTWDELARLFEDLPEPHPAPSAAVASTNTAPGTGSVARVREGTQQDRKGNDDMSGTEVVGWLVLLSGGPATVVHGVHTGSWWAFGAALFSGILTIALVEARRAGRRRKKQDPGRN
ncbi:MAG TPA: DUF1707 domain-containing protein [Pseudonocardiaceae bacterium]